MRHLPLRSCMWCLLQVLGAVTIACGFPARAQTPVNFNATIHTGESYTHPIGRGLFFSVKQDDGGSWNFQVKPSETSSESYTDCLTSPVMHGPNTTDLLAWRFAAAANPDWAEHLPAQKRFSFVTTAADQKYECAEQQAMYNSFQRSQARSADPDYSGLPHYRPRPHGSGEAVVTSLKLKPGLTKENAEFAEVTLHVSIRLPAGTSPGRRTPPGQ